VATMERVAHGRRDFFGVVATWATQVGGGKWAFVATVFVLRRET
jgi:hypothetical protein